ncbi:aquaglyceroporin, putative [Hepatocystis sp. ex Piliocolobus tephrosceles]|nr:aquaglyceroporin, putative [Hepatocystis sp. ex Piliocolobus tephrosceles]
MAIDPVHIIGKEVLGEFLGTFILMFIGEGSTATYTITKNNDWFHLCMGWGLAVFMGVLCSAKLSGAHLNLAVTLALSSIKKFDFKKIPHYFVAQLLGAFSATAAVYGMYCGYIKTEPDGVVAPKFVWETAKDTNVSTLNAFAHECILTGLLILVILLITDETVGGRFSILKVAAVVGTTVATIGMTFGKNTGFALNPSRDLGARLLSLIVTGSSAFTDDSYYCWVPFVGPIVGAITGGLLYHLAIKPLNNMEVQDDINENV